MLGLNLNNISQLIKNILGINSNNTEQSIENIQGEGHTIHQAGGDINIQNFSITIDKFKEYQVLMANRDKYLKRIKKYPDDTEFYSRLGTSPKRPTGLQSSSD